MRNEEPRGAVFRAPLLATCLFASGVFTSVLLLGSAGLAQEGLVNFAHLDFLTDTFEVEGSEHLGVWIYAEPSPAEPGAYLHRGDADEGVTCVDDVARAALVYLQAYRANHDAKMLETARGLLGFVLAMQSEDGEFVNFVFEDGTINRLGITSREGAGFWAARALWALAEGIPVFAQEDPEFAQRLREAFLLGVGSFTDKVRPEYGTYEEHFGYRVPGWLPDDGADVASILLLGLSRFLSREEHPQVRELFTMVANGLSELQYGSPADYPFLAHSSFAPDPNQWHAWGSRQTQALARASQVEGDDASWLASAEAEAGHFFVHLLASRGPIYSMNPSVRTFPQIAYGMESLASGYFALADATGKGVYDELGGLMTGWLLGNNELRQRLYDPETGRVFDGLERGIINRNSGAESTITGLLALQQAVQRPAADALLDYVWLEKHDEIYLEVETGSDFGQPPATAIDARASGQVTALLREGASVNIFGDLQRGGRYRVYAIYGADPWEGSAAVFAGRQRLGTVQTGGATEPHFRMQDLGIVDLDAGKVQFTVSHLSGRDLRFDALVLRPEVMWKLHGKPGERLLLLKSWSDSSVVASVATDSPVAAPGADSPVTPPPATASSSAASSFAVVRVFDRKANLIDERAIGSDSTVELPPFGFAIAQWTTDEPLPTFERTGAREGQTLELAAAFGHENYLAVDLAPTFNNDAFSLPSEPEGNFDNHSGALGATYPAERAPEPLEHIEVGGIPFLFPPTDANANNTALVGQSFEVPIGRYDQIALLGSSEQGNYQATVRLVYEDGSAEEVQLGLSDWCQLPRYGEVIAFEFAQRRGASGAIERITCRILLQSIPVTPDSPLVRIELPDRETMHLFAVTLRIAP